MTEGMKCTCIFKQQSQIRFLECGCKTNVTRAIIALMQDLPADKLRWIQGTVDVMLLNSSD